MVRKGKKKFDALAFKRRAQARIAKALRGMTAEEQREYLARRAESGPLGEWVKMAKKATLERKKRQSRAI